MKNLITTALLFTLSSTTAVAGIMDIMDIMSSETITQAKTCSYQGIELVDSENLPHRDIYELSVVGKGPNEHLPASYEADDLVAIDYQFITPLHRNKMMQSKRSEKLRRDAYYYLKEMLTRAHKSNIDLFVHSAYRSYATQCHVFTYKLGQEMKKKNISMNEIDKAILSVNTRSALPGTSEHQMGTTVDLVTFLEKYGTRSSSNNAGYALEYDLEHTPAFKWLDENAHNYGFVLSYPKSKLVRFNQPHPRTGYIYEPWHWRYIHPHYAKRFKQCGALVLSDFLKELTRNPNFECNQSYISRISY